MTDTTGHPQDHATAPAIAGPWRAADWVGLLLILLSVDFFPSLPDVSLDSSWMSGMTAVLAQGAVPGRDLLFTYGPLAGMLTGDAGAAFLPGLRLAIDVRTCDGEPRSYRFVPGMATWPLPPSPMIENAAELRQSLFDGNMPAHRGLRHPREPVGEPDLRLGRRLTVRWHEASPAPVHAPATPSGIMPTARPTTPSSIASAP